MSDSPTTQTPASGAAASPADEASPAPEDPLSSGPGGSSSLRVNLNLEVDETAPPLAGWLDVQFHRLATLADVHAGEVTLTIVDDATMADLHGRYKADATTTDVLTFDLRDAAEDPVEADLVLCMDEAARQAARRGHETRLELLLYALHGLMHLLGEDDHTPDAFEQMHAREDRLLAEAGFGPVFAREEQTDER